MENNQFPQGQDEQVTAPQPEAQPQPAPQAVRRPLPERKADEKS